MGGYPVATGIVAIHGLETDVEASPAALAAHHVARDWPRVLGRVVLDGDRPEWLWIAMGIYATPNT